MGFTVSFAGLVCDCVILLVVEYVFVSECISHTVDRENLTAGPVLRSLSSIFSSFLPFSAPFFPPFYTPPPLPPFPSLSHPSLSQSDPLNLAGRFVPQK